MGLSGQELEELWLLFESDGSRSLDEAERHVLELVNDACNIEGIQGLGRAIHSLKGNVRAMGLNGLEDLLHILEAIVGACQEGELILIEEPLDAVCEAIDTLRLWIPEIVRTRADMSEAALASIRTRLYAATDHAPRVASNLGSVLFDNSFSNVKLDFDLDTDTPDAARARPTPSPPTTRDTFIQVRASKIRELLSIASDLGLSADTFLAHPIVQSMNEDSESLTEQAHRLRRLMRDLRFSAAGLALVPMGELFAKIRRTALELSRGTSRAFEVVFEGEETELDKSLLDGLADAVVHIVRNAVDHGFETREERLKMGKEVRGRLTVSASYSGNEVRIAFADDGRGLDPELIRAKAIRRNIIPPELELNDEAIYRLILEPGFTTRETVTDLSGRGIGMDVVNESIKALRGRIQLLSRLGQGTTVVLHLPLTLAFADALVVESGRYVYAIPLESVGRIFVPKSESWVSNSADSTCLLRLHDRTIPVCWLEGYPRENQPLYAHPVVTTRTSMGEVALPVERLRGTEQITIRPLSRYSSQHPAASACGILSNGEVATTLDCERLLSVSGLHLFRPVSEPIAEK